jgi:hypothetical protein
MGRRNRAKGKTFELFVAKAFRTIFPKAKRHLEYQKEEAKGYDLDNTGRLLIQCKAAKRYVPISTITEVQKGSKDDVPVLVTKGDRMPAVVCLYMTDFIKILDDVGYAYEDRK